MVELLKEVAKTLTADSQMEEMMHHKSGGGEVMRLTIKRCSMGPSFGFTISLK